jgi:uncharacterized membrane protein YdbT with pleckstrin-like domain
MGERYPLKPFGRAFVWVFGTLTVVFTAWVPLTWMHGNIINRSLGGAIYFFGVFAIFLVVWVLSIAASYRRSHDPDKNFVEIRGTELVVKRAFARNTSIALSRIKSVAAEGPAFAASFPGMPGPTVTVKLQGISLQAYFGFGTFRTIGLPLTEPERFVTALRERLTTQGSPQ